MDKIKPYLWYVPALFVAFMFATKLPQGLAHSEEFIGIISQIPFLRVYAYNLAPVVGIWDFCVGLAFLLNPYITRNPAIQRMLFLWVALWPFVPACLRYFGKVGDFEVFEVLAISAASALSYVLWKNFSPLAQTQSRRGASHENDRAVSA